MSGRGKAPYDQRPNKVSASAANTIAGRGSLRAHEPEADPGRGTRAPQGQNTHQPVGKDHGLQQGTRRGEYTKYLASPKYHSDCTDLQAAQRELTGPTSGSTATSQDATPLFETVVRSSQKRTMCRTKPSTFTE